MLDRAIEIALDVNKIQRGEPAGVKKGDQKKRHARIFECFSIVEPGRSVFLGIFLGGGGGEKGWLIG